MAHVVSNVVEVDPRGFELQHDVRFFGGLRQRGVDRGCKRVHQFRPPGVLQPERASANPAEPDYGKNGGQKEPAVD